MLVKRQTAIVAISEKALTHAMGAPRVLSISPTFTTLYLSIHGLLNNCTSLFSLDVAIFSLRPSAGDCCPVNQNTNRGNSLAEMLRFCFYKFLVDKTLGQLRSRKKTNKSLLLD